MLDSTDKAKSAANDNEIEKPRWIVEPGANGWIVADTYCPGDFFGWLKTEAEALAEARRRNAPGPRASIDDVIVNDDDIPLRTAVERRNEQMGRQARASSMRLFAIYRQLIIQEMPHESNDELSGL